MARGPTLALPKVRPLIKRFSLTIKMIRMFEGGEVKVTNNYKIGAAIVVSALLAGCTGPSASKLSLGNAQSTNQQFLQVKMNISIPSVGYSDTVPNSPLILKAGSSYVLNLAVSNAPAGTSYSVQVTNLDQVNASPITIPIAVGNNNFSVPTQGNYQLKLTASAAGFAPQSKIYQAQVQCASPTFTQASLANVGIAVSGSNNNYNYTSSGVNAGANGQPPYTCAWDPNGTGIVDTTFAPCDSTISNVYANLVLNRNVGLVVRDACNTAFTVSKPANLAYAEPTMGAGNVFIQGSVSGAGGTAVGDSRVDGATYFASNTTLNKIVSSQYGNGAFTIFAWQNYNMGSSVNWGMQIKLSGLQETTPINVSAGTGAISAANASIASVTYVTDQAGDQSPSMSFSGKNCTLTNQGAKVLFVVGQPCTGGTSGDANTATVEVWGHYSCTGLVASDASLNIQGDFDGYFDMADSCSGSGQSGGNPPPNF